MSLGTSKGVSGQSLRARASDGPAEWQVVFGRKSRQRSLIIGLFSKYVLVLGNNTLTTISLLLCSERYATFVSLLVPV